LAAISAIASSSSLRTSSSRRIASSMRARTIASASSRSPASADSAPPATPARSSKNRGRSLMGLSFLQLVGNSSAFAASPPHV
jgi:hypothetical protein